MPGIAPRICEGLGNDTYCIRMMKMAKMQTDSSTGGVWDCLSLRVEHSTGGAATSFLRSHFTCRPKKLEETTLF